MTELRFEGITDPMIPDTFNAQAVQEGDQIRVLDQRELNIIKAHNTANDASEVGGKLHTEALQALATLVANTPGAIELYSAMLVELNEREA
jgi:hypothetical protein